MKYEKHEWIAFTRKDFEAILFSIDDRISLECDKEWKNRLKNIRTKIKKVMERFNVEVK